MKVLILYTAHTLGHQKIAENIAWWLRKDGAEVILEEVLGKSMTPAVKRFLKIHIWVNRKIPWLWAFMYKYGFWLTMPFRILVASKNSTAIAELISKHNPEVVITTQTSPSAVMEYLKKNKIFNGKWIISFSDFHFHRYWYYNLADGYLTNIKEQAEELVKLGVDPGAILTIGMAVHDETLKSRELVLSSLGLSPDYKICLVSVGGGTLGQGLSVLDFKTIDLLEKKFKSTSFKGKIVVACGKDQHLLSSIQEKYKHNEVIPVDFYSPFRELLGASDVVLGKLGGLTTAEAFFEGKQVMVSRVLPGQEEENLEYLTRLKLVRNLQFLNAEQRAEEIFLALQGKLEHLPVDTGKLLVSPGSLPSLSSFCRPFLKAN